MNSNSLKMLLLSLRFVELADNALLLLLRCCRAILGLVLQLFGPKKLWI